MISTGSKIRTLLDEALVWFDLEGALGVGVSMASDLGVLGEVCDHDGDLGEGNGVRDEIW